MKQYLKFLVARCSVQGYPHSVWAHGVVILGAFAGSIDATCKELLKHTSSSLAVGAPGNDGRHPAISILRRGGPKYIGVYGNAITEFYSHILLEQRFYTKWPSARGLGMAFGEDGLGRVEAIVEIARVLSRRYKLLDDNVRELLGKN